MVMGLDFGRGNIVDRSRYVVVGNENRLNVM